MKNNNNIVNVAVAAAFGLPAGAPGREGIVLSASRLRAGETNACSPQALLAVATAARNNFFAARHGRQQARAAACRAAKGRS